MARKSNTETTRTSAEAPAKKHRTGTRAAASPRTRKRLAEDVAVTAPASADDSAALGPLSSALTTADAESRFVPEREQIAVLAYSYWEQRGYEHGYAEQDWLRAEQELSRVRQ